MPYQVTKSIAFCYGHRLLGHDGQCRYLHGHNGRLEIDVETESLDHMGMVVDFRKVRNLVKGWIDANLDHRMILCKQDPAIPALRDLGEPLYLLDENPTAENLARLLFEQVQHLGLRAAEVRLWETPTSYATYRETGRTRSR